MCGTGRAFGCWRLSRLFPCGRSARLSLNIWTASALRAFMRRALAAKNMAARLQPIAPDIRRRTFQRLKAQDHVIFYSPAQSARFRHQIDAARRMGKGFDIGLRIYLEHSEEEDARYEP